MINRATALAVAVTIAIVALILLLSQCERNRGLASQQRMDRGQAGAARASGADALNTLGNAASREAASEQLSRDNGKDIRNAEGSTAPVAAPVRDAGLRALCRREAYRDNPRCRVQQPRP